MKSPTSNRIKSKKFRYKSPLTWQSFCSNPQALSTVCAKGATCGPHLSIGREALSFDLQIAISKHGTYPPCLKANEKGSSERIGVHADAHVLVVKKGGLSAASDLGRSIVDVSLILNRGRWLGGPSLSFRRHVINSYVSLSQSANMS